MTNGKGITSWRDVVGESQHRPKYPDSPFIIIADLVNEKTGKTYREENAEKVHNIPIGSLVEDVETGVRLFVVYHSRDCDQTPLYNLAANPDDATLENKDFFNRKWHNGYPEHSIRMIEPPSKI